MRFYTSSRPTAYVVFILVCFIYGSNIEVNIKNTEIIKMQDEFLFLS